MKEMHVLWLKSAQKLTVTEHLLGVMYERLHSHIFSKEAKADWTQ